VLRQIWQVLSIISSYFKLFQAISRNPNFEMTSLHGTKDRKSLIIKKEKEIMKNRDKILALNDSVSTITERLKEKRTSEKSLRVANSRNVTHGTALQVDFTKRPPDRYADIRSYSQMDMDCWRYNQLRDWFNSYAPANETKVEFNPVKSGYTIKIDP
jgi:hypothetical protein